MECIEIDDVDAQLLAKLPPLPTPDYRTQYLERARGTGLVLSLIAVFVAATTSILQTAQVNEAFTWAGCSVIWAEAIVALICLAGIQLGDPGEVKRTDSTCLPIPTEVKRYLSGERADRPLGNIDGDDGRVYCVRCFLWRPYDVVRHKVHHCRTCQRCVTEFDHHCGVLGRCIAGNQWRLRGNMCFFVGLIGCGQLGFWTFAAASSVAVVLRWGWPAFGIAVATSIGVFACGVSTVVFVCVEVLFKRWFDARMDKFDARKAREERQDEQTTMPSDAQPPPPTAGAAGASGAGTTAQPLARQDSCETAEAVEAVEAAKGAEAAEATAPAATEAGAPLPRGGFGL